MSEPGYLRIGELARRTGASPELLRAWERRYGLLRPTRSQGGFRLYTAADEERIRRMRGHLARGVAAAEAARLAVEADASGLAGVTSTPAVLAPETEAAPPPLQAAARELAGALDRFDEEQAHAVLDRASRYRWRRSCVTAVPSPLSGRRWARGEVSVPRSTSQPTAARQPSAPAAGAGPWLVALMPVFRESSKTWMIICASPCTPDGASSTGADTRSPPSARPPSASARPGRPAARSPPIAAPPTPSPT